MRMALAMQQPLWQRAPGLPLYVRYQWIGCRPGRDPKASSRRHGAELLGRRRAQRPHTRSSWSRARWGSTSSSSIPAGKVVESLRTLCCVDWKARQRPRHVGLHLGNRCPAGWVRQRPYSYRFWVRDRHIFPRRYKVNTFLFQTFSFESKYKVSVSIFIVYLTELKLETPPSNLIWHTPTKIMFGIAPLQKKKKSAPIHSNFFKLHSINFRKIESYASVCLPDANLDPGTVWNGWNSHSYPLDVFFPRATHTTVPYSTRDGTVHISILLHFFLVKIFILENIECININE